MRKILYAMKPFLIEITHDFMMAACLLVPVLMGTAFRIGIPLLEKLLCSIFNSQQILIPYYLIFDLLLAIMTPVMFTFVGVMTVLSELDNGTAKALCVTPIGKNGYIASRIVIPSCVAFVYDIIVLNIFSISKISFSMIILVSILSVFFSIGISLLVISIAKNKLEGMALVKMCGLLIVGIPVVYFVPGLVQYLFSILPSFWITKLAVTGNYIYFLPSLFTCGLWILVFALMFKRKLI